MTGQPFNSVNLLVKPRSSQCCQYLTLAATDNVADATKISDPKVQIYTMLDSSKTENATNQLLAFRFPLVTRIISLVASTSEFAGASTSNCIGKSTAKCEAFSAAVFQVRRDDFAGFSDDPGDFLSYVMIAYRQGL